MDHQMRGPKKSNIRESSQRKGSSFKGTKYKPSKDVSMVFVIENIIDLEYEGPNPSSALSKSREA